MQRELKFRAWDEDLGMSEPFDLEGAGIMFLEGGNPDSIMQYTGLRDKNGKEIYEGDIVRIPSYCLPAGQKEDLKYVEFIDGKFVLRRKDDIPAWRYDLDSIIAKLSEVVGNIYSNSELLKEGE